jgi:hypothetical protein
LPADQVEALEGLVDEVERVPSVGERPPVAAANSASASSAGEKPAAIAVSRVRSAASRWRTVVQRRSQRLSAAGSGRLPSGGVPATAPSPSQSVREQQQRQHGPKVYSQNASEVEGIGKGKAHRPYEFGVKVSVATTQSHAKGGQFVTHVKSLPGNPYDGHTLERVIPDMEALVGNTIERILADKGYRGHNAPPDYKFRVFIPGPKRGGTPSIKRALRCGSAVEPVIGHLKAEHRMGRNYLWFLRGDANNAVLAAAGYNFRRLIRWSSLLLRQILAALFAETLINPA